MHAQSAVIACRHSPYLEEFWTDGTERTRRRRRDKKQRFTDFTGKLCNSREGGGGERGVIDNVFELTIGGMTKTWRAHPETKRAKRRTPATTSSMKELLLNVIVKGGGEGGAVYAGKKDMDPINGL